MSSEEEDQQSLLTPKAYALALSAPRAPPVGTAHRSLLLGQDPSQNPWAVHHNEAHSALSHQSLRQRLYQRLLRYHQDTPSRHPHPHLPAGPELGDQITRFLGVILPLQWQNDFRDSGNFRSVVDTLVTLSAPALALTHPSIALSFRQLTKRVIQIRYGSHHQQHIDLFLPTTNRSPSRLIFFMHGGAWGSGTPWMYRLTAKPFLEQNYAVAIVGYRTYPDSSSADHQIEDCELAAAALANQFPELCEHVTLMGHSSGAHITFLLLVDRARRQMKALQNQLDGTEKLTVTKDPLSIDSFVGLSGPYDISHHFDYEAARGVEELSPMKPVCGYSRQNFRHNSPAARLMHFLAEICECEQRSLDNFLPRMVLIHGIEDDTVPFTSTGEAARILRSCGVTRCQEFYVAKAGHQDTIMHMMMGGRTRDVVLEWIKSLIDNEATTISSRLLTTSRL